MDCSIIDQYEKGPEKLRQAVAGFSEKDFKAAPIPGKWSTQHLVIHLADAEAALADRIRRLLAQDEPLLLAWDENRFAQRLRYDDQSAADAIEIIALTRRQLCRVLRGASDAELERAGTHNERGRQTVRDVIGFAVSHLDHHLKFVDEKRKALGK